MSAPHADKELLPTKRQRGERGIIHLILMTLRILIRRRRQGMWIGKKIIPSTPLFTLRRRGATPQAERRIGRLRLTAVDRVL